MSQDFIDSAVDSLRQGGNPFVLVALSRGSDGSILYHIRSGHTDRRALGALRDIVPNQLTGYLNDPLNFNEGEDLPDE